MSVVHSDTSDSLSAFQSLSLALSPISTSPYFLLVSWWNVSKNFWSFFPKVREFKKWQHQGQRHITHKSMIWLVEWGKTLMLHVQDAFWCNNFLTFSAKWQCKIIIFVVLKTMQAHSHKSSILCLYMKTIPAKQVKVHFIDFVHDQHRTIAKHLI